MNDAYAIQIVQALQSIVAELQRLRAEINSLKIRLSR